MLREQVDSSTEVHRHRPLAQEAKDKERADFTAALDYAKAEAAAESKALIAEYNALAKHTLTDSTEQPYAAIQSLHKANEALYELMDLEVSSSGTRNRSPPSRSLRRACEEDGWVTVQFFQKLRDMEAGYHERPFQRGRAAREGRGGPGRPHGG